MTCYCTWYHSLPGPPVRWQVAQQVGVTSLTSFCCSLIVFLCTSRSHPWLCLLGYGVPMGHSPSRAYPCWCEATSVPWGCLCSVREHLLPWECLQPRPQGWRLPHVPSVLFPFLSQNTSLPHVSPAPASVFFSCIWSEMPWAPPTGCSFGVLTVVPESAGPRGAQP